ncbi:hypothetical protein GS636_13760 [Ruegeria sp. HKCCD4884]|uniref:hypothetical protein n=1 Tax=Ruegeria sp. HKCCD4884 TaxID=2683022 RepID=UPI0014920E64|nr:hypothetical protein [Ruegeria sp. HKCCD4884]NOD93852.1 hypothetical protein [Ruegeria sp. HKCCD4884]
MKRVSRRDFVRWVTHSLPVAIAASPAFSASNTGQFFYTRSGKFTAAPFSAVLLGGLVIDDTIANELEKELEEVAKKLSFNCALEHGTGTYHVGYYEQALKVLESYPHFFWGAYLTTKTWEADNLSLPIWRRQAELIFLQTVAGLNGLRVSCVRHARGQDNNVNRYLQQALDTDEFQIFPSGGNSPRVFQLSSVIAKSVGSIRRTGVLSSNPQLMKSNTIRHFGITSSDVQVSSNRASIQTLALDFG